MDIISRVWCKPFSQIYKTMKACDAQKAHTSNALFQQYAKNNNSPV